MRAELAGRLDALEAEGLRRALITVAPPAAEVAVAGRAGAVISLASNDYLGLAGHPALAEAAAGASRELGTGAGASRLVTGNMELHEALERRLAALLGEERALLYGSGYLAHVGTIPALMDGPDDVIYSDQLNHASIVDGCRLSRARVRVFRHRDVDHLEQLLAGDAGAGGRRLVVTETVFSMDGDEAPLARICELAARFDAWMLADEAHAFGVRGPRGGGVAAELGLGGRIQVRMATLGKAAGSYGAFIAGTAELCDYLVSRSRTFIYSTALPPPVVAAAATAVELIGGPEGERLRAALRGRAERLRDGLVELGFDVGEVPGPILPLFVGDPRKAVALGEALLARGVLARAMRYPTVPRGTERLRLVTSAAHAAAHIDRALRAFEAVRGLC